jgi:hypothetical protein
MCIPLLLQARRASQETQGSQGHPETQATLASLEPQVHIPGTEPCTFLSVLVRLLQSKHPLHLGELVRVP